MGTISETRRKNGSSGYKLCVHERPIGGNFAESRHCASSLKIGGPTRSRSTRVEAASYHKHIHFFRRHRDLMAPMAQKLADELIHPQPPGHVHVVLKTAAALGIAEEEVFLSPMLAEFRAKIDFKRAILWEGTVAEFYAAARQRNKPVTGPRIF